MIDLLPLLYKHLDWHPSRIKCVQEMIFGALRCKSPHHTDLADYLSGAASQSSKAKRIYRLFRHQEFASQDFAQLLGQFCPPGPWLLTLDRTNWECGDNPINILALCVVSGTLSIPLLVTMLPKDGASNSQERIEIVGDFIRIFGIEKIKCLLADREFWDEGWIHYLHQNQVPFTIRVKSNLQLAHPNGGTRRCREWLREQSVVKTAWHGVPLTVYAKAEKDLHVATSLPESEQPLALYKRRWSIETCFKALKSQGFNLERTQVDMLDRVRKLVLVLSIGLALAQIIGEKMDQEKMIRMIKANASKAYTWFKAGLKAITAWLTSKPPQLTHCFYSLNSWLVKNV